GVTERVSVDSTGAEGRGGGHSPSISADGRFVAFDSSSPLVPEDTNCAEPQDVYTCSDVFVRDRQTGTTERVSVSSQGVQGNDGSYAPSISADGRYVAFVSFATNLVYLVGGGLSGFHIYVHDRQTGPTEFGIPPPPALPFLLPPPYGDAPALSADGRFVAFRSSDPLLRADLNRNSNDVFVRDRQS